MLLLVAVADVETNVVQQGKAAEGYRYVVKGNHWASTVLRHSRMESSNKPYNGTARTNMENGSLGVMKAANTKTITNAYLRQCFNLTRSTIPRLESTRITVGNSNNSPIRNTMEVKSDI